MDAHIKKVYVPMTETGFYILLCLQEPNHGYGIVQKVKTMTGGDIVLAPWEPCMAVCQRWEKDGLSLLCREEDKQENIRDHGTWQGSAGNRKETELSIVPE